MVDLAYWSDFDTSRRDAASAFATLSMNGEQTMALGGETLPNVLQSSIGSKNADDGEARASREEFHNVHCAVYL